jgi:hypothetical protein
MSYQVADRILETTTTTGTGTITLLGAVGSYRAFSSVILANGDMFPYVIAGGAEWETGIGTRLSATTFSRVPTSSSNAGALVSFSAGTKEVWIDFTAAHITSLAANNLVINAGMEVSQRFGTSAVVMNPGNTAAVANVVDGIQFFIGTGGTAVVSCQQVTDAPPGFKYSVKGTVTTADAAVAVGDYALWRFYVEGYKCARLLHGTASASSIALGFWVKANRTGTYSGSVINGAFNRAYAFNFTINVSATWEYKTIVIPGDTTGTWDVTNGSGLVMTITMMCGTTNLAAANTWSAGFFYGVTGTINGVAATTDFMNITGISIVPGIVPVTAEQSPLIVRPFDEALVSCQRYLEKSYDYPTALGAITTTGASSVKVTGTASAANQIGWSLSWKVRKRNDPTVTIYSPATGASGKIRDDTNAVDVNVSGPFQQSETGTYIIGVANAASTQMQFSAHYLADSGF